jgi:UDP-N-acetylmuramoyl-L-alanyl-D-glutamate--2,6-diaminopimelate ligase
MAMELQALIKGLASLPDALAPTDMDISAICYDSRQVTPGSLYVARQGSNTDGHEHIPQAIAAGAVAIVCDALWYRQQQGLPELVWLPVAEPQVALAQLAAAFNGYPASALKMVGLTGTNGKTTTAHLISQLLGQQLSTGWIGTLGAGFDDVKLPGKYTTPFPPELHGMLSQMREAGVKAVAMECSSHALEQHRLDAIEYDVAVFTNLTQDHLDYHHTLEAYAAAKGKLFSDLLKPSGTAVINREDPRWELYAGLSRAKLLTYAVEAAGDRRADLNADELEYHPEGVSFKLGWQGQSYPVKLRLPGRFNVQNALAALGVALALELPLDVSLEALQRINGVPGRLERVSPDAHPFTVYVDYAHTPDSLENALQAVRQFTPGRVLVVFGCGGDRDRGKRPLMGAIAETLADRVYITSDNPRSEDPDGIIQEILTGLKQPEALTVKPDRREAIRMALLDALPGDVVLIAGKGHEDYQLIGKQTLHFDDREEARLALERTP